MRAGLAQAGLLALTMVAGCGGGSSHGHDGGGGDGGAPAGTLDLAPPPCVMDPKSGNDLLNGCTSAQGGDPAKDYPYHPKLAPDGNLPPLN